MRIHSSSVHGVFLWILLLLAACPVAGQTYSLQNDLIQVSFNEKGIRLLKDKKSARSFAFSQDGFALTINDKSHKRPEMVPDGISEEPGKLTYLYKLPGYALKVVYTLEKDWSFVSKHLEVQFLTEDVFRINSMQVFDMELAESISSYYVPRTSKPELQTNDYGVFLRFSDAAGMLMTVQNPFLTAEVKDKKVGLAYKPEMNWQKQYGSFHSDKGIVGVYQLSGNRVPAQMIPEWKWTKGVVAVTSSEQDEAEVEAFTDVVSRFVLPNPEKSIKLQVGWCENDYQIDIADATGRNEYKRIIDQTAALGLDHILFTPSNSLLGSRDSTTDDWGWENLLWLSLGIKIRSGTWDVEKDPIPPSVQQLLDYAKSRNVQLVSYLYPSLPFAGNKAWIVEGSPYHDKKKNASLGVRAFQDYLIKTLSTFYERTGISGYSYDYTYLWYEGSSRYEQWWGWKRVKETLRTKYPSMIIDGRQLDHLYGPWTWLSGSFPHPTAEDEQPESFIPFPDLHFDRVSANRQRYTAYRYRVNDFCPPSIMPGFIFHQTPRNDWKDGKTFLRVDGFRRRDWDYLGWKYSLFSSIATGGLNHVVNMIPARDEVEMKHFSAADKKFITDWLKWTDTNREYLKQTKFILGQPAFGKIDGTTAIKDDKGFIFLFNPNARGLSAEFLLNAGIGLGADVKYKIRMLYPYEGKWISPESDVHWSLGDLFRYRMDGSSAAVFEISKVAGSTELPVLYNVKGDVKLIGKTLQMQNVSGETGTTTTWKVELPSSHKIETVTLNGKSIAFKQQGNVLSGNVQFAGKYFAPLQSIIPFDPSFTGGNISASFEFPKWVPEQLALRKKQWPMPWTKEELNTTWLAAERLLLYVQIAEPSDTMDVQLELNGQKVELKKAYTSIGPRAKCFVGWYCDISALPPDKLHNVKLSLPSLKQGQFQGIFLENIEKQFTSVAIVPAGIR